MRKAKDFIELQEVKQKVLLSNRKIFLLVNSDYYKSFDVKMEGRGRMGKREGTELD